MHKHLDFNFLPLPEIFFGSGKLEKVGEICSRYNKQALIVASETVWNTSGVKDILESQLMEKKISYDCFFIKGEPEVSIIDKGVSLAKEINSKLIIGLGGGSVIDAGKAIAGIVTNGGKTIDYMEVIGKGKKIAKKTIPYIAIPTTSGTGSEVTKNAVILSKKNKLKASIRSPLLIPDVVIIDPKITVSLPKKITASCGMDAFTQLIEAYTSINSQPITDSLALLGIRKVVESLIRAYIDGKDIIAREDMAMASLLSGICLANAGLGAVHGFAGPIGGMYKIPHGIVCGALLHAVLLENSRSMFSQVPFHHTLAKYARLGELVSDTIFDEIREAVRNLIGFTSNLTRTLKIPKLKEYGLRQEDFDVIIQSAKKSSSMKYNPVSLSNEQLVKILSTAGGFI